MKIKICVLLLMLVSLATCGSTLVNQFEEPMPQPETLSIYTDLGRPDGLNGYVARMDKGGQTCYFMWGGTTTSTSCPVAPKVHAKNASDVVYIDLGHPDNLNGHVAEMRDGEQTCYLVWAGKGVDISCP